ncbi:hypothetical protein PV403_20010 [Paenibacillus sp. GYB006]|uniref:hypothetical protein n=1 Tax=Paenibacillus sp. GYB006 TaxID=2994394 RepID=UPI002F96D24B
MANAEPTTPMLPSVDNATEESTYINLNNVSEIVEMNGISRATIYRYLKQEQHNI